MCKLENASRRSSFDKEENPKKEMRKLCEGDWKEVEEQALWPCRWRSNPDSHMCKPEGRRRIRSKDV